MISYVFIACLGFFLGTWLWHYLMYAPLEGVLEETRKYNAELLKQYEQQADRFLEKHQDYLELGARFRQSSRALENAVRDRSQALGALEEERAKSDRLKRALAAERRLRFAVSQELVEQHLLNSKLSRELLEQVELQSKH